MDALISAGAVVAIVVVGVLFVWAIVGAAARAARKDIAAKGERAARAARETAARKALHAPVPVFDAAAPCQKCGNGSGGHTDKGFAYRHYEAADPDEWREWYVKDHMRGQQPQREHVVRECLSCGHVTYSLPWGTGMRGRVASVVPARPASPGGPTPDPREMKCYKCATPMANVCCPGLAADGKCEKWVTHHGECPEGWPKRNGWGLCNYYYCPACEPGRAPAVAVQPITPSSIQPPDPCRSCEHLAYFDNKGDTPMLPYCRPFGADKPGPMMVLVSVQPPHVPKPIDPAGCFGRALLGREEEGA